MKVPFGKFSLRRTAAFTLVEVVISMCIIAIGAAGLMGSFRYAFFAMRLARENQRATQIVLERAEAIRCFNWDKLIAGTNVPPSFSEYYDPTVTNGAKGTVYNGFVSITPFVPQSGPTPSYAGNMRVLTIGVTWKTGPITRGRTNITYVSKGGIQNYVY